MVASCGLLYLVLEQSYLQLGLVVLAVDVGISLLCLANKLERGNFRYKVWVKVYFRV